MYHEDLNYWLQQKTNHVLDLPVLIIRSIIITASIR